MAPKVIGLIPFSMAPKVIGLIPFSMAFDRLNGDDPFRALEITPFRSAKVNAAASEVEIIQPGGIDVSLFQQDSSPKINFKRILDTEPLKGLIAHLRSVIA
jgi:hypothetical protein